jgi:farnesyl diphosphate synthase
MAGGQAIDLAAVGRSLTLPELEFMHILKTGALIRASVTLGARCGALGAAELDRLDHYAKLIGLAFQVVDDVLDADASTATLGKTAGKDAAQGKPTYVSLLGIERARELAEELRREAHEALEGFGERADCLRELADFIVLRRF